MAHIIHGLICCLCKSDRFFSLHFLESHQSLSVKSKLVSDLLLFQKAQSEREAFLDLHYEHAHSDVTFIFNVVLEPSRVERLPGIDEILGQADVSGGPCDGNLTL